MRSMTAQLIEANVQVEVDSFDLHPLDALPFC